MKNTKIRVLAAIMALSISLSFAGCNNSKNTSSNAKENTTTAQNKTNSPNTSNQEKKNTVPKLEANNWAKENYEALENLINTYGVNSPNYDASQKPYAVFDWDNTSIVNDVEEALLVYQLKNLEFKMTPEVFDKVIKTNIPADNFVENCNNKDGKQVNIDLIAQDIDSDYKFLYENYEGMKGTKSLDEMKETLEYKDFVAKTRYLYEAIGETFSADISYPWVTYLFTGMTKEEVQALTAKSNKFWLDSELSKETLVSPEDLAGKAGVVSVTFKTGLRILPEQQNLYKTLRENGIDVYICSASFVDVVKTFAANPKFGYNLPEENVIAMELERDENGVILPEWRKGYDQTQNKGKTLNIEKFLVSKYGYGPILIGGDSGGDVAMMKDFADTKLVIIVNRCKGEELGKLSKIASETIGNKDVKYLLQGRDENTGKFRPSQKSIFLGSDEEKLLK